MGVVGSRPDDGSTTYFKDQSRFAISQVSITSSNRRNALTLVPNAFPATRVLARRDPGDETPIDFIQDPAAAPNSIPSFLLRINSEDDLTFTFSIVVRQTPSLDPTQTNSDSTINGLTFIFAPNSKELDTLVTREFHADPNLHKNSNVELVRQEVSTDGSPSIQFDYVWRWKPPKSAEDKGGGWKNACTFVEYDQRAHRLNTLAAFTFWIQNTQPAASPMQGPVQGEMLAPPRIRVASSQSAQSVMSDSETNDKEPPSPAPEAIEPTFLPQPPTSDAVVDISCVRPGEDIVTQDDSPLFRATMKSLESKTGSMKGRMKKVLKKAEAAQLAQVQCNDANSQFMDALREAASTNANAIQPALDHYFEKIARQIMSYETQNTKNLQRLIIDPLSRVYNVDIKAAEYKKKEFEEESKDYYAFVSRYLGQRQDSLKEKKRVESDTKYQTKRRNFELKRFDYSSFITDLHGGRKEQEVLSHLTRYADTQAKTYLSAAKKIEEMMPQLDALIKEVSDTDKEYRIQRTEREEKRRLLEKTNKSSEQDSAPSTAYSSSGPSTISDAELGRADSSGKGSLHHTISSGSQASTLTNSNGLQPSSSVKSMSGSPMTSPGNERFKGFRDLEDRSQSGAGTAQRKEGLLWALSKPGSHVDPRGLNKQAWHKFWIVLDQGKLAEYSNWKERLDLHMEPIDLRLASVREARNSERRFCFEVITPNFKRVYQATSEEDMTNWINAINNALQSAVEGHSQPQPFVPTSNESSLTRDIGSVLTGKSPNFVSSLGTASNNVSRRTTVNGRPNVVRTESNTNGEDSSKLLQEIRDKDQSNTWCADCGSSSKVEWVSINLGIVLCIECSGIHRSLGTHISKVRSLTLDNKSFSIDIVEIIMQVGNRISNGIWEAKLDVNLKPGPMAAREERLKFATDKYVERLYIDPITASNSHYGTADDTLLASIKKNDIQQVLYALANRANANAKDKSRSTPAVFLALAAADPASPHPTTPPSSRAGKTTTAFPVAELLLQNGGEMPTQLPAFPLSPAAKQYFEQRSVKASTDTLTALPSFKGAGSPAERERLQKRNSSGNRFGGRTGGFGVG